MNKPIAVLGGTGPAGSGIALRLAKAGEAVLIGSRDQVRAKDTAAKLSQIVGPDAKITGLDNAAACAAAEVCILTVPFDGQAALLKSLKQSFRGGTLLIDATVPLAATIGGRPTRVLGVWQGSAAQQAAELVPKSVAVAAAFHNVSADLLHGQSAIDCDVLVCSDDDKARQLASQIVEKIPRLRALDGGKLENARIVEQITALLIGLNIRYKTHNAGIRITGLSERA
jgi:8-hydroxy-5-deazaflavin:NADPH oxidoreductase